MNFNAMTGKIKRHLQRFANDKIRLFSFIIFSVMLIFHAWQFIDSGHSVKTLLRLIFTGVYIILIFTIGRKAITPIFILYGLTLAQFMTFQNYTPFIILVLAGILEPKGSKILMALYVIDAAIMFIRTGTPAAHIFIHATNCFIFQYSIKTILRVKFTPEPLELTPEERAILEELRAGKQQKEINLFSQNTITKYLRNARERNKAATTEELLVRFISDKIL